MTAQSGFQSREQGHALLAQCGQRAANATKGHHPSFRAKGARDLLLHFDHADISLRLIVVKGDREVGEEGQHRLLADLKPIQQIDSGMASDSALAFGSSTGGRSMGLPAVLEHAIIVAAQRQPQKRIKLALSARTVRAIY